MAAALPVLVAGAGPVGLTAALVLAREGVPVEVFERGEDLAEDLRASTWHPPTLDMLDAIDPALSQQIIATGLIARHTQYRDRREGLIAEFDLEMLRGDTAHPYRVQCEQFKYTGFLLDALAKTGCATVHFGHPVSAVRQSADAVEVDLASAEGTVTRRGAWLVGADGVRSVVRQAVGIEFDGFTFPEHFYTVSTPHDFAEDFPGLSLVNYVSDPQEWCVLLKVPGLWRVLFPTPADEPDERVMSDEATEQRLQGVVARSVPYETRHRTIYRVHQRVARQYQAGRVLIAGDAAHVNNPLGGMGMNGGLHDAISLARRLVRITRGEDAATLLAQYERERRPIAIEYINANTGRNKQLMEERDPAVRRKAHDEMRRTATDPVRAREFLLRTSMITALRAAATAAG
jgi:3-(3-hydroxy-phenyl)propionate hydroxylase